MVLTLALASIVAFAQYPTEWRIADAEVGGPAAMETAIAIENVSAADGLARVTLVAQDGTAAEKLYVVPAAARIDMFVGREFPAINGTRFTALVESLGAPPAELGVEWTTYSTASGITLVDGHATGMPPSKMTRSSASMSATDSVAGSTSEPAVAGLATAGAGAYNIRLVSDASPDLTDLKGLVHSATARWSENRDKVWALFYWTHVLRRQTSPMVLHGFEVTDPILNLADYGFTMCSTVTGINQTLYEAIGLRHQYWDICHHTVSAVEYDGKFHMVDSSMSNLVTTDDGVTLASVPEAAADSARLVRERSLHATSPNGFLTGTDHIRNLVDAYDPSNGKLASGFANNFCANGLKLRDYYYNWNSGHRSVLNLRPNESYTRHYRRLGETPEYWVGSERISSPDPAQTFQIDAANEFGLRGNGSWSFSPDLSPAGWERAVSRSRNLTANAGGGLRPVSAAQSSEAVYKVQAANAITSQTIRAEFARSTSTADATVSISINHGLTWTDVGSVGSAVGSAVPVLVTLRNEVSGAHETLVRVQMRAGSGSAGDIVLNGLTIETLTQVNARALPRLNVGRNEIYVDAGDQTDTMVLWPDLRADLWKRDVHESHNIASQPVSVPRKYTAVAFPAVLSQDAWLTYRLEAPTDITRVVYGGRLHNYRAGSYIDFLHSFDHGATWIRSYRLSDARAPYDVIHYQTVTDIPAGVRTVLFKFYMHNTETVTSRATGLYSVRIEASHRPLHDAPAALDVTFRWKEVRADRTTVDRSHRQRVSGFPFKYVINAGGHDHPVMESIKVNVADEVDATPFGYSDGVNAGGEKYIHVKRVDGTNVARGRPYTFSRPPSGFQYSAGANDTSVLTNGVVGAPATGGISYWWGQCWSSGANVDLQIDLGAAQPVSAFRAHLFGYPFWDALEGQVQDRVEILTSVDGVSFSSQGLLQTSIFKKEVPINHMLPDDEEATAWNFERTIPAPVSARYVRYRITPKRILCASELHVFDRVVYEPFDIRIALPAASEPAPEPAPNARPAVGISTPVNGATFEAPASIGIVADASDPDGTIQRVDFFAGSTPIGTATASPFVMTWRDVAAGSYVLSARATDNAGASSASAPVAITVEPASTPPPGESIDEIVLHTTVNAQNAGGWTVTTDATAASGARLQNPNNYAAKLSTPLAAPTQSFDLTFTAQAGKAYRLWLRGKALNDSYTNDSVFVQFDGSADSAGTPVWRIGTTAGTTVVLEDCSGCGVQGWGWADNGYGLNVLGPLVYFATSGTQRIRIQMREDGLGIDQVVLSAAKYLTRAPGATKNDTTVLERSP